MEYTQCRWLQPCVWPLRPTQVGLSQVLQKRTRTRKFEGISTQVSPCQCNDIISKGSN